MRSSEGPSRPSRQRSISPIVGSETILGSLINVMKQTVMASAIAVPELLSVSLAIMADKGNVTVMMNVLLLTYLLLISLAIAGLGRVQAWLDRRVANL